MPVPNTIQEGVNKGRRQVQREVKEAIEAEIAEWNSALVSMQLAGLATEISEGVAGDAIAVLRALAARLGITLEN